MNEENKTLDWPIKRRIIYPSHSDNLGLHITGVMYKKNPIYLTAVNMRGNIELQ
jgi:hypothetical protein